MKSAPLLGRARLSSPVVCRPFPRSRYSRKRVLSPGSSTECVYLGCEGCESYSSSASAAVAAAAARSDGRLACSPHRARGSSLCAAVISHLSCSACVCVVSMQRLEKGGRGGVAHVLLLADCEYAEGDECAPQEGLAAGSLGEAEEAPDVLTLRG